MLGFITDPDAEAGLAQRELREATPAATDVVIEVKAYAVNRGELGLLQQRTSGWAPGQDVAGVVVQAAAEGGGAPVGTRVVGAADGGGWAERVVVPWFRVGVIPDKVSFAEAAALPVAGLTALRALRTGGALLGRRVLITGASGGVGSFAVQLGKVGGAHVTAHVSGPHRVGVAHGLGADEVVTSIDEKCGPFDLVVDGVGGQVLVDAIRRLAPGGTATAYGMAGGEKAQLVFNDFRGGAGARLIGFRVYGTDLQTFGEDLAYLARLIADGKLQVHREVQRDWSETRQAIDLLRNHSATGKVVLTIGG